MLKSYYQEELSRLKELGAEFAEKYPALAPMLRGPSADPDVERLLQGTAFLTSMLREKLDDDFPEIIHDVMQIVAPHYLRPLPCSTIVTFTPKPTLVQPQVIPAGTQLGSVPVEGTSCRFRTTSDVEIHPLEVMSVEVVEKAGQFSSIEISLRLNGLTLSQWRPGRLRFFLGNDFVAAADILFLLQHRLRSVSVSTDNAESDLPAAIVTAAGFGENEFLLPYPSHANPGFRLLQEYFMFPQRFLFFDVALNDWSKRGDGKTFKISFKLDPKSGTPPCVNRESFVLHAVPVVNIFPHDSVPVDLTHRRADYPIRPSGKRGHYSLYSVEKVTGLVRGSAKKIAYVPFDHFAPHAGESSVFHLKQRRSHIGHGADHLLSVHYRQEEKIEPHVLSIDLLCTNGVLPESLRIGDVCVQVGGSAECATFRNILPMTPFSPPPLGQNILWRLNGHLALNRTGIATTKNLQGLLRLYLFGDDRDSARSETNRRRIEGIEKIDIRQGDRLHRGLPIRGAEITLTVRGDHFASVGDLNLFASVIERFLAGYAGINTYTRVTIREVLRGETHIFPTRIGCRQTI